MKNKYFVIVILVIILAVMGYGGYLWYQNQPAPQPAPVDEPSPVLTTADSTTLLKSARLTVPDDTVEVTLVNGNGEFPVAASPIKGMIWLGDVVVSRPSQDGNELLATMVVNSGGTGNFVYLTLFREENGVVEHQSSALLGDRVKVENISFGEDGVFADMIVVNILDRREDEAMAVEPTVPKQLVFAVEKGELKVKN